MTAGPERRTRRQTGISDALKAARAAYDRRAWQDSFALFSGAEQSEQLGGDDLERLAWSAALTGRDNDHLASIERAYHAHIAAGADHRAARCAFWLAMRLMTLGEAGQASGWLSRAERLIGEHDCAERGYLMVPQIYRALATQDHAVAVVTAERAIAAGERFGEADLVALARGLLGRTLIRIDRIDEGLAALDEAMLSASPERVLPIVTGLVYCGVIDCCQQVFALDRCREWTAVLADWCAGQPQMVPFAISCHIHRAEVMQIAGDWDAALIETRRAGERLARAIEEDAAAPAHYQEGELLRLRGDFSAADAAYHAVTQAGADPQPGLALLRLAQGQSEVAAAAIRRALAATPDHRARARLLPAAVEILLAVGDRDSAATLAAELEAIAGLFASEPLHAAAAHARGALLLDAGDAGAALAALRQALAVWQHFGAPYLAARVRALIAAACARLGDEEGAARERAAARTVFADLGAKPDLAHLGMTDSRGNGSDGLTGREREVLRLVAAGRTNREIGEALAISAKTVDRHVSNILVKLAVPSRTAATAYAYAHGLI